MYQAVFIDDEAFVLDALSKAIDWSGFHTEIAFASTEPTEALTFILNHPVHIVITDVSMPSMNGMQLIRRIKEAKPSIYVIVLSAYNNFEYVKTALRYGAENYLLKPLDSDELSDTVSQIVCHIREREQIINTYGRSMMTFRSAFTEQWLKNLLSSNDMLSKAALLGINLEVSRFTVAVFSCLSGQEAAMSRFFDLLLRYLPGHYIGNFYFETPLRLVSVLSPSDSEAGEIRDFLVPILLNAQADGLSVFASAGATVTHYSQVHISYQQACSLTFLKASRLPFVFYENIPGLSDAASEALGSYNDTDGTDLTLIHDLFRRYDAAAACYQLLSCRLSQIRGKDQEQECSELKQDLSLLPLPDPETYEEFTLNVLQHTSHLLIRVQQSVYPMVDAVIRRVNEFTDKDISLKTLAARLNVSPSYLGTVFHQQTGYYFNDYLTDARLKYAAELLETTDLKIKDIVDKIGFSSQTYFNRAFKRYFDTSPVSYRRNRKMKDLRST